MRFDEKISTYIFDFDGTLVDSMPAWADGIISILEENGVAYPEDIIKIVTPLGNDGTVKYLREQLGLPMSYDEVVQRMKAYYLPRYLYEIPVKQGVKGFLEKLQENGASLNVLTASSHNTVDPCLKRLEIFDLFDNVWSCDDFEKSKTDTSIYTDAIGILGENASSVAFFDDNIDAVQTAKKAGLFTVGVYDESGESFKDEMKQVADLYIDSFEQLI